MHILVKRLHLKNLTHISTVRHLAPLWPLASLPLVAAGTPLVGRSDGWLWRVRCSDVEQQFQIQAGEVISKRVHFTICEIFRILYDFFMICSWNSTHFTNHQSTFALSPSGKLGSWGSEVSPKAWRKDTAEGVGKECCTSGWPRPIWIDG